MHEIDGRLRLATLLIRIVRDDVEDADIPEFLRSAGTALANPFTQEPMSWDRTERRIHFGDSRYPGEVSGEFRVPSGGD